MPGVGMTRVRCMLPDSRQVGEHMTAPALMDYFWEFDGQRVDGEVALDHLAAVSGQRTGFSVEHWLDECALLVLDVD